jgi:hypothetical protein
MYTIVQIKLLKVLIMEVTLFGEIIKQLLIVAFLAPIPYLQRVMQCLWEQYSMYPRKYLLLRKVLIRFLAHFTTVVINMHTDLHAMTSYLHC